MTLLVNTKSDVITVELAVASPNFDKTNYALLYSHKEEIEKEIETKLDWRELADKKVSRIILEKHVDLKNRENRNNYFNWYKEWAVKIYKGFKPHIDTL